MGVAAAIVLFAIGVLFILTIADLLFVHYPLTSFKVQGISMAPTFTDGEFIAVNQLIYRFHAPSRGDVIVYRYPNDPSRAFLGRVIALAGDRIAIKLAGTHYRVFVKGVALNEPYIAAPPDQAYPDACSRGTSCVPYSVPAHSLFVMGDNRNASFDSRIWGALPESDVIGQVSFVYWPLSRAG